MDRTEQLTTLFRAHAPSVYRLCRSYLGPDEAEDAVQTVFLKAVQDQQVLAGVANPEAFLIRCAANHCKNVLKSARVAKAAPMPEELDAPGNDTELREAVAAVLALPQDLKDCAYLAFYEGYTSAEVGEMLGMPASTVRSRLQRHASCCARYLEAMHDDERKRNGCKCRA